MLAKLSAAGVPTLTVLHGPSTAGGAYMPGMSDYNVGVKHNGMAALGGRRWCRRQQARWLTNANWVAPKCTHSNGLMEYLAEDDAEGILQIREVVGRMGWNEHCPTPPQREFDEPIYDADEILGLVPTVIGCRMNSRELIARLVDGSNFTEFKARFGPNLVCTQASIFGHPVGLVSNNGPMGPDKLAKGAHFSRLSMSECAARIFEQHHRLYGRH